MKPRQTKWKRMTEAQRRRVIDALKVQTNELQGRNQLSGGLVRSPKGVPDVFEHAADHLQEAHEHQKPPFSR